MNRSVHRRLTDALDAWTAGKEAAVSVQRSAFSLRLDC
jgi:hypothetical protein